VLLPGPTASAEELVRQLSDEQKEAIFTLLLEEVLTLHSPNAALPFSATDGAHLGYIVPQNAATKLFRYLPPVLTEEQRRFTEWALAHPDDTFDVDEFLKDLRDAPDSEANARGD